MTHRLERVNELLKQALAEVIRRELPLSEAGLISVNEVKVTTDLHTAAVYLSILGDDLQQKRGADLLRQHRKLIQQRMGQAVVLKYTPQLRFILDDSIARGNRVLAIIEELDQAQTGPCEA
jgi:ribosome-binding factor A